MFGSCWLSQLLWLSGKQFCLPCVVAENTVSEFSGGLPLQEIAATCLVEPARPEGGPRKVLSATGSSAANGAGIARTRAPGTILYFLAL